MTWLAMTAGAILGYLGASWAYDAETRRLEAYRAHLLSKVQRRPAPIVVDADPDPDTDAGS